MALALDREQKDRVVVWPREIGGAALVALGQVARGAAGQGQNVEVLGDRVIEGGGSQVGEVLAIGRDRHGTELAHGGGDDRGLLAAPRRYPVDVGEHVFIVNPGRGVGLEDDALTVGGPVDLEGIEVGLEKPVAFAAFDVEQPQVTILGLFAPDHPVVAGILLLLAGLGVVLLGGEGDPLAVRRPAVVADVPGLLGQQTSFATVSRNGVDLDTLVNVLALDPKGDELAVGRPSRRIDLFAAAGEVSGLAVLEGCDPEFGVGVTGVIARLPWDLEGVGDGVAGRRDRDGGDPGEVHDDLGCQHRVGREQARGGDRDQQCQSDGREPKSSFHHESLSVVGGERWPWCLEAVQRTCRQDR